MFHVGPNFFSSPSGGGIVILDEFQGTGNLTGHVPDLVPEGLTAWETISEFVTTMELDTAGGYAYGPGSDIAAFGTSGGRLGNIISPQNLGLGSVGKITIGFTMGTSNDYLPGGFAAGAVGVRVKVYINNEVGNLFSLGGQVDAGSWALNAPGAAGPKYFAVPTPAINTNYEFIIEYTETDFTLSWNGYSATFPFPNAQVSGLNAIEIITASRTGGGVLWRYLQVEVPP